MLSREKILSLINEYEKKLKEYDRLREERRLIKMALSPAESIDEYWDEYIRIEGRIEALKMVLEESEMEQVCKSVQAH